VPSGSDFKATMMIEYPNEADRKVALAKLVGIEHQMFIEVEGQPRIYAIADEDLERSTANKTSAVHFMRFDLSNDMKRALKAGAQMMVGCDHKGYPMHVQTLPSETLASLVSDLS
jgi:imidazolonepropionase-like amidohydrolase